MRTLAMLLAVVLTGAAKEKPKAFVGPPKPLGLATASPVLSERQKQLARVAESRRQAAREKNLRDREAVRKRSVPRSAHGVEAAPDGMLEALKRRSARDQIRGRRVEVP